MASNKPEASFRAGGVKATVWKNEFKDAKGGTGIAYTVDIKRSYMDKDQKWQETSSFKQNDLPKVLVVTQKAYEHLVLKEKENDE